MDIDKSLGRLAIVVPVFHVITCAFFLFGYSLGFGSRVGSLFKISDFFTVSLEHLTRVYVLGLAFPLIYTFYRHRTGTPYASDAIAAEADPVRKEALIANAIKVRRAIKWLGIFASTFAIATITIQISFDLYRSYFVAVSLILVSGAPLYWIVIDRANFRGMPAEITWLVLTFIAGVITLGADIGFDDRRLPYDRFAQRTYACKDQAILMSAGDGFLSISKDGRRHMLDKECAIAFDFPQRPPLRTDSIFEATFAFVRSQLPSSAVAPSIENCPKQREKMACSPNVGRGVRIPTQSREAPRS